MYTAFERFFLILALAGLLVCGLATPTPARAMAFDPTTLIAREALATAPAPSSTNPELAQAPLLVEVGFYVVFALSGVGACIMLWHVIGQRRRQKEVVSRPDWNRLVGAPTAVYVAQDGKLVSVAMADPQGNVQAPEMAEKADAQSEQEELCELEVPTEPGLLDKWDESGEWEGPADLDDLDEWGEFQSPAADDLTVPALDGADNGMTPVDSQPALPRGTRSGSILSPIRRKSLEAWLRRAVSEDAPDLMAEGIALDQEGHKAEAYDIFVAVTRLAPGYAGAWLWRGGLSTRLLESAYCLEKVLELDPDNVIARKGLDWTLARLSGTEK